MNVIHACARKHLLPGNLRCGRVCADRSLSCTSGTAPSTGAAEGRHRWPRPSGKSDGISEFVACPRPDVAVVQTERAACIDQQARLIEVSGQWSFENARPLEGYQCLNPLIHDMPQIVSLSFTVSPRHYAARSR